MEKSKSYGPVASVFITVGIYIASQIAAAIMISLPPLFWGWTAIQTASWVQDNVAVTFVFVAIIEAVTLGLLYYVLKRKKTGFGSLGLGKMRLEHVGMALAGIVAYFVIFIAVISIVKALIPELDVEKKQDIGFAATTTGWPLILVFISLVVLPPITEEIITRGFLFGGLRTKLPFLPAAIITSTLFGAAHLAGASSGVLWIAGIDTFVLSIVLCYLREKSGSLYPSILVHALKNSVAFIVLFDILNYFR